MTGRNGSIGNVKGIGVPLRNRRDVVKLAGGNATFAVTRRRA
jgi:hypothetical protein